MRIHFDNKLHWPDARLWWCKTEKLCERDRFFTQTGHDDFGPFYDLPETAASHFIFQIQNGEQADSNEKTQVYRYYSFLGPEIWVKYDFDHVYHVEPAQVKGNVNDVFAAVSPLFYPESFQEWTDVSGQGVKSMLGATILRDGTCLFSFFHPRAARVYLCGDFNDWQHPGREDRRPEKYVPMHLYRGFYGNPNIWLARIPWDETGSGEYKYFVQGGIDPLEGLLPERLVVDPYTRVYGRCNRKNNSKVTSQVHYQWKDNKWKTPPVHDLFLYELSVFGITQDNPDIPREKQGTFQGLIDLIRNKYFNRLGMTALALMPTSEAPSFQGPHALGYDPCGFMSIERDFGTPDDFRELVDTAHQAGLAVIVDQVFNHTSNVFNPLWGVIQDGSPGGFYFSGGTPWGNRVATEKEEVQNLLIDACKVMIREYHIDGFRFDATHSVWLDHRFLINLAHEIKDTGFKPDCILICENLPNEPDLNLQGYNGFAQWCDPFHDKLKALLREGVYQDWTKNDPGFLGDIFYFCKSIFAAHTNNVINYCESHDENSIPYEVETNPAISADGGLLVQKTKLALMAVTTALGQPMIYMGQEFGVNRPRNLVFFDWPQETGRNQFFRWAQKMLALRQKFPEFRVNGFNPEVDGKFAWVIGPWFPKEQGGGSLVIGWRSGEIRQNGKQVLCLFNFGPSNVSADLHLVPGDWIKIGDLNEIRSWDGGAQDKLRDDTTLRTDDGVYKQFQLPPFSGYVYYHPSQQYLQ